MADMKENNMNDGVPSLDETAAEAVRLSVGPRPITPEFLRTFGFRP